MNHRTESESDIEDVVARRQHVPRHGDAPGVVHIGIPRPKLPEAQAAAQAQPAAPPAVVAPGAQHRPPDQHQAPAAPATAAKQVPAAEAPVADEAAAAPMRVSARSNKGRPPRRYSPSTSSNIVTIAFTFILLLFFAAIAGAQDVIVLPKLGAVAEKVGEVAVDLGSAQFPMVLRLVIHDTVHNSGHSCLTNAFARHSFEKEENHLVPSWIEERGTTSVTTNSTRKKRSPILAAVGIAVGVSALFNLFTGSMTSKEIADIKEKQNVVFTHMQTLDDEVSKNHNDIVKIVTAVGSLYEYTHKSFREISEKLKRFECTLANELTELSYAMQRDRMMNKLYVDLVGSIVAIFNHHPTPLLLPMRTIKELIKQNFEFFANTIYIDHEYLVYHYGFIFPVLPMNPEALGYILRLPRIMKPSLTSLYSLSSTGILINNKIVQYNLPKHAVVIDNTLKEIVVSSCTAWGMDNYLCSAKLHTRDIHCISNSSNCQFKSKIFNEIFYNYNRLGYSIVSNITCKVSSAGIISKINSENGFYYVPFNISGFAHCGENFMLALEKREFIYDFNYKIEQPSSNLNLIDFSVEDWSDVNKLKELQAAANRHAVTKIKDFIHENNVSFVGILTLILIIIIIFGSLFLCYYFKCYSFIYSKILYFYQRARKPKNNSKISKISFSKNRKSPERPLSSLVHSTSLEQITQVQSENQVAGSSESQPAPVARSKNQPQDATSDRITLDF